MLVWLVLKHVCAFFKYCMLVCYVVSAHIHSGVKTKMTYFNSNYCVITTVIALCRIFNVFDDLLTATNLNSICFFNFPK